jgi:cell division GTPase FtsZ
MHTVNTVMYAGLDRVRYLTRSHTGTALMGIGTGRGKDRAVDAALSAISSPLLGFPISQVQASWLQLFL